MAKLRIPYKMLSCFILLLFCPPTSCLLFAQQTGETVKDKARGITFKVPKGWLSIPIDPMETRIIHKYQAKRPDQAKKNPGIRATASLDLFFFPKKDEGNEGKNTSVAKKLETIRNYRDFAEKVLNAEFKKKPDQKKIKQLQATLYSWTSLVSLVQIGSKTQLPFYFRTAVFHTEEGDFAMQFQCMDEHKKRHTRDMDGSIHTFGLIQKEVSKEDRSQLSNNIRYLEEQKDRLSKGWYWENSLKKDHHYVIFSNAAKRFADKIATELENIHAVFSKTYPEEPRISWIPIVRVCATKNEYHGYGAPEGSAGYWWDVTKEFVFYDDVAGGEQNTLRTLRHEAFHHFMHFYIGCPPATWFNEGHADYYAGSRVSKGGRIKIKVNTGRRDWIQRCLVKGDYIPLKEFVSLSHSDFMEKSRLCYAQGWSFIYFLLEGKKNGAKMQKNWQDIPERFLQHLLETFAELEKKNPNKVAGKDEVNSSLASEANRIATEKTFFNWTDKDWEALESAWLDFTK